jgi:phosphate:Na+ symporter
MDLGGAIALLIWGVHMVQTGITRAFGPQLRRMLSYALGNRFKAFLAGVGVTSILQSSTATGLMVTAFAAGGLVDLVPALVVMLGANVGTTLIVQVLSFDVSRVSFLLILIGVFMFRRSGVTRTRDLGRVGIGLGLMLIALQHLLSMITPYEDVPSLRILLGAVTTDPLIDILLAAGLTWAAHSSVAVVLLIMSFAAQAVVPPHAAFALVLGREFGLGQTAGGNKPFPKSGNGRRIAARLERVNEIPACPQRGFVDRRQEPSRAQFLADQRQRAHDHAKTLKCRLDRKVEMLEDLIACRG